MVLYRAIYVVDGEEVDKGSWHTEKDRAEEDVWQWDKPEPECIERGYYIEDIEL